MVSEFNGTVRLRIVGRSNVGRQRWARCLEKRMFQSAIWAAFNCYEHSEIDGLKRSILFCSSFPEGAMVVSEPTDSEDLIR